MHYLESDVLFHPVRKQQLHFLCLSLSLWWNAEVFDLPTRCQIRLVMPAWFLELLTKTDRIVAVWSITLSFSLILSTYKSVCASVSTGFCASKEESQVKVAVGLAEQERGKKTLNKI